MIAAKGGHRDVVELLVEKGADVTAADGVSQQCAGSEVGFAPNTLRPALTPLECSPSAWEYGCDIGG